MRKLISLLSFAVGALSQGVGPGARIPDFRLPDQNGNFQTFQSVRGPKGAMLVFYRSADW
jgi:peroxiredoxin